MMEQVCLRCVSSRCHEHVCHHQVDEVGSAQLDVPARLKVGEWCTHLNIRTLRWDDYDPNAVDGVMRPCGQSAGRGRDRRRATVRGSLRYSD